MPHTALRIFDITPITGNDVNMNMGNTLPSCLPYVNADVIAVGFKLFVQQLSLLVDQRHAGADLFGCQLKKGGNMATRDYHRMTRAHRIRIARCTPACYSGKPLVVLYKIDMGYWCLAFPPVFLQTTSFNTLRLSY